MKKLYQSELVQALLIGLVFCAVAVVPNWQRRAPNAATFNQVSPLQVKTPSSNLVILNGPNRVEKRWIDFGSISSFNDMIKGLVYELSARPLYAQSERLITSADAAVHAGFHRNMSDGLWEKAPRPLMANVHIVARHPDGTIFYDKWVHNLRTNAGINWQYGQMAGTTAAVATYICLSSDTTSPATGDTTVAGEITTSGLTRSGGTASHTSNATSYTVAYTFTAGAAFTAVQKAGLLNASSAGTLVFENTFSSVNMNTNDTLAVTWTINF
jgi:hypothetical protein